MKHVLSLLLCLCMVFALVGCSQEQSSASQEAGGALEIGFGRRDITPESSVQLRGYFNAENRWSKNVLDPLYATCVAFSDQKDNTALVFHLDLCSPIGAAMPFIRRAISDATGVPFHSVMVSCTHTHSAPNLASTHPTMETYSDFLEQQMVAAAQEAMADRKTAQLYTATAELENMNFIRHYNLSDGTVGGDGFGDFTANTVRSHVEDADNVMQLVRITREGGKDILLVNWQTHPHRTGGETLGDISADIVGSMRMYLEPRMDCHMAYFTGASGNVNPTSRIPGENLTADYIEQGTIMARAAIQACDNMQTLGGDTLQLLQKDVDVTKAGGTTTFTNYALAVGDLSFVFAPYEMFNSNGMFIKENSPYPTTFVATCSNASNHYVADSKAYEYKGDEPYEVGNGGYDQGTGELLAQSFVDMLTQLHGAHPSSEPAEPQHKTATLCYKCSVTADQNGGYTVVAMVEGEQKTFALADEALAQQLESLDFFGAQLEGERITALVNMSDLPYQRLAWDHYVQSMGGKTVKLNAHASLAGQEVVLKLTDGLPIYDITPVNQTPGSAAQLQKNDCISVIADRDGTMLYVYITERPAVPHEGMLHCAHCNKEVAWMDWISDSSLPVSDGHYILQTDIQLAKGARVTTGSLCLDLNGKTVTQTTYGERVYSLEGEATLSIMDPAGGGTIVPNSGDETTAARSGMGINIVHDDAVFNLYGGTLDGRNSYSQTGCVVRVSDGTFNMYDGTILGGTVYGTGSSAITASDVFNMYGGRVVGGKHIRIDYAPTNPPGGGAIRVLGYTTIYGGTIEGGESYQEGGVIRLTPDAVESRVVKLTLLGGTITGGKAPIGGGIYAKSGTTIVISGDVVITGNDKGNLYAEEGVSISIGQEGLGENANIGIAGQGITITDVPQGSDLNRHFSCDESGQRLVNNGDGTWSIK